MKWDDMNSSISFLKFGLLLEKFQQEKFQALVTSLMNSIKHLNKKSYQPLTNVQEI